MVRRRVLILTPLVCLLPLVSGCFLLKKPDKANIDLRKQNQQLQTKVDELQRQSNADAARVRGLESKVGTLPTLPQDRLAKLFTTHELKIGRLTGGADLDPGKPGHEGLKVYVTPLDGTGDQLKAAGTFTVEAFDLSRNNGEKIGTWTFDLAATRAAWSSVLNRYNYVLTCPWQQSPPGGTSLHLEITFVDELTQAQFKKSLDVTVEPPAGNASTAPTTPGS